MSFPVPWPSAIASRPLPRLFTPSRQCSGVWCAGGNWADCCRTGRVWIMAETTSNSDYKLIWDARWQTLLGPRPRADLSFSGWSYRAVASVGDRVYILSSCDIVSVSDRLWFDVVFEYLSTTGECQELPPCRVVWCALANVRGKLTTVGGVRLDGDRLDASPPHCLCWDETSSNWEPHYPPLPQSGFDVHSRPLVATTVNHLIAIHSIGDEVGVMDINARQWSTVAITPTLSGNIFSLAICEGAVYVLGSGSVMLHCSLDALLHSTNRQGVWQVTVYPGFYFIPRPGLVTVNNKLLRISQQNVLLYEKKRFLSVESIPFLPDWSVTCGLPGGRIFTCSSTGAIVVGKLSSPAGIIILM